MYNECMSVLNLEKKNTASIWTSTVDVYDFFSIFLERHVINISHVDLSFIPVEYFEQLLNCENTDDGQGYLNLLMMLFTEFYQEKVTGKHKIMLPEEKYQSISAQFLLYAKCELLRRDNKISYLSEENLFNPNLKTIFTVDSAENLKEFHDSFVSNHIILKELRA